jgi:hypothetical protein
MRLVQTSDSRLRILLLMESQYVFLAALRRECYLDLRGWLLMPWTVYWTVHDCVCSAIATHTVRI